MKRARGKIVSGSLVIGVMFLVLLNVGAVSAKPTQQQAQLSPQDFRVYCLNAGSVASQQLWTPVILLNSPYDGSSSGSSTSSTSTSYTFSFSYPSTKVTTSTSSYASSELSDSNGAASGFFQLDTWTVYKLETETAPGAGYTPCSASYMAEITGTSSGIWTTYLLNPGTSSDSSEPTTASHNGYNSVQFYNGYSGHTGTYYNCAPSGVSTGTTTQTSVSTSPTVSFDGYSVSGSISMQSSQSTAFTYNFPNDGTWYWSTLDGSANNGAWAFDYVSSSC